MSMPSRDASFDSAQIWSDPALGGTVFLSADYRTQRFNRHFHKEYAIGIIESGCQTFLYDRSRRIDMTGGTVALISPGMVHSGGPGLDEGWTYRMLYPSRRLVDEAVIDVFGNKASIPSFGSPGVVDRGLYDEIGRLHQASIAANHDRLEIQSRMVRIVRLAFEPHASCVSPVRAKLHHPGMSAVRDRIEDGYACDPGLQSLADHAGVGRFQLLRQFKLVFGLPPHAYLKQVRVARAQALILSGLTLADVAASAGFADQAHMTRVFRESRGYTPGALRRSLFASPLAVKP
nr:AraC family transcriptional regulator [uncultured Lichenicoccus sp.]